MAKPLIRMGTRGSPLALAQARILRDALISAWPDLENPGALETVVIKTIGDSMLERPLGMVSGKGMFTKELEQALLRKTIDVAVHSVKDMPSFHHDDLILACTLKREMRPGTGPPVLVLQ